MPVGVAPQPDIALAERLFTALDSATRVGRGIRRDSYGEGEQVAHRIVREAAVELGLEIATDAAMNLYMTLPGRNRDLPPVIVGSHLDSVDQAGNFDGAAGVLAGLAAVAGLKSAGVVPARDITVMAIRCEEVHWFDGHYVGSSMAFGRLDPRSLTELHRSDTGRPLAEHIADCGGDIEALQRGDAYLHPSKVAAFIELHIEQAPVLVESSLPIGVVTGIRGYRRYSHIRCIGEYGHSGALPRRFRKDCVAATVHLVDALHREWLRLEEEGHDLVFTVGRFHTDAQNDGPSKVPGETVFSIDCRSTEAPILDHMMARLETMRELVEQRFGVMFEFGHRNDGEPAPFSQRMVDTASALVAREGIPFMTMASGAGHDAAVFAGLGVPTAMIFVRNRNGSHNPDEAMDMDDFAEGARLLSLMVGEGLDDLLG